MENDKAQRALSFYTKERQRQQAYRINNSNIPSHYFDFSWSSYDPENNFSKKITNKNVIKSRKLAKCICASYAKDISKVCENGKSLIIIGKRSSGKTVLATLILRTAIEKLVGSVYYIPFSTFALQANTANLDEEREFFLSKYIDPKILCIDEVDEIDSSSKIRNYFGNVIDQRQKDNKPTIITSKISLLKIKELFGSLIFSAITNQEYFLNPIIIETEEYDTEDTVWIQGGRNYNLRKIIDDLGTLKDVKEKKYKKNIYISSNELKDIIISSDMADCTND